MRSTAFQYKTN